MHGSDEKERNVNVITLLKRSREKGVTVSKANVNSEEIALCTTAGCSLKMEYPQTHAKGKAIKSAGRPRNAVELNLFLCTVRYSSRCMEARQYQKTEGNLCGLIRVKTGTLRSIRET